MFGLDAATDAADTTANAIAGATANLGDLFGGFVDQGGAAPAKSDDKEAGPLDAVTGFLGGLFGGNAIKATVGVLACVTFTLSEL